MAVRWYSVVVGCRDPRALAAWWAQVLGWRTAYEADDEVVIIPPHMFEDGFAERVSARERGQGLVFVPVPEGKTVKNRLHIDLAPEADDDQDVEVQRLLDLGARRVDVGQGPEVTWVVLADPEGNEFCVLSPRDL
ncbi:VOC family protein [Georgenia satyanarayanai]|uniref:VOC family protein n=1 Tax=Georgenia satyanarayanai TaxID=860221 RepID=UPI00203DCDFC|nr:VOC family protein [Georgenia satyanarayanai]MCM3661390.1 VOC family protein [Georgenia satyanarayanai]